LIRPFLRLALLALFVASPTAVRARVVATEKLVVEKVSPDSGAPGDHVTITLSRPVKGAKVSFGGVAAEVESQVGNVLYVKIPTELKPGESPPINIVTFDADAVYVGFTVLYPHPDTSTTGTSSGSELTSTTSTIGESSKSFPSGFTTATSAPASPPRFNPPKWPVKRQPPVEPEGTSWFQIAMVSAVILFLLALLNIERMRRRRLTDSFERVRFINERAQATAGSDSEDPVSGDFPDGPPPIPDELVSICASGNCVLFAGPGLGAQAGFPTRYEAVGRILQTADIPPQLREQLAAAINSGQLAFVTEVLAGKVSHETLVEELQTLYLHSPEPSAAHKALGAIPFAAAVTSNWDPMIEAMFSDREPKIIAGEDDILRLLLRHNDFFIAKINGDLKDASSVVFSSAEARETMVARPNLAKFVAGEVLSRPVLFVGMSISGIQEFFENFRFRLRSSVPAYAILPYAPFWEAQCGRFEERYGVKLIGYKPTPRHPEFTAFATGLAEKVKQVAPRRRREQTAPRLRKVRLTNIGVFTNLEVDFSDGWNLILGNNGSGKSTILRAIALALCGNDNAALVAGQRLLRQDATAGKIELTVGDVTYETSLRRDPRTRRVSIAGSPTPLQKRDWVVLGFPPLRGISLNNPVGPGAGGSPDPQVEDLIPVITGAFDTRLDSLKQWLVNLEVNSSGTVSKDVATRNQRLLQSFFSLLTKLIPGQSIAYGHIDRTTWQAYVITEDGEVPIDDVSQGMGSIFGWAGTLLQRLYEIHTEMENPALAPALVLIDEIDAHLHPEWQQKLVPIVREEFKNLQVVATTHSPLIVGGMKQNELIIADRDFDDRHKVGVTHSLIDPEGLRADQVLTTPLFGLQSTRSPEVVKKINRYALLFGKTTLTDEETKEMQELKASLSGMLVQGETPVERQAERAAMQATRQRSDEIVAAAAASSPEAKEMLRKELETE
jgi:energy-coupling factor transporter ATP-binding protein EcfA2